MNDSSWKASEHSYLSLASRIIRLLEWAHYCVPSSSLSMAPSDFLWLAFFETYPYGEGARSGGKVIDDSSLEEKILLHELVVAPGERFSEYSAWKRVYFPDYVYIWICEVRCGYLLSCNNVALILITREENLTSDSSLFSPFRRRMGQWWHFG